MKSPIKVSGDKWHLKDFIISNFPENYEQMTYVEPFCAGATILLNKNASEEEVICDKDEGIVAILKAIRDEPKEFISRIKRTTYSERAFKMAQNKSQNDFEDYIDKAVNEYILRKMSRGGSKKTFAASEKADDTSNIWDSMTEQLEEISERIKNVSVLCKNFIDIIKAWDETNTLFYLDPPAIRSVEGVAEAPFELTVDEHLNLIHLAKNAKAKVIISGFSCPLYNRALKAWKCKKKSPIPSAKDRRIECVWINY